MATLKQGSVSIALPSNIEIKPEAGKLTPKQTRTIEKRRSGIGLVCERTAAALLKDPSRLVIPNLTPEQLVDYGKKAEDTASFIIDLEVLLVFLKQNALLLDAQAHRALRQVLAVVRSQEKFDPNLSSLVPDLIKYFARSSNPKESEQP